MAQKYQFQYMPVNGKLPGAVFEQQTEDAINDLGNRLVAMEESGGGGGGGTGGNAQEALEKAEQALTQANSAATTANSASAVAASAQKTAQSADSKADKALALIGNLDDDSSAATAAAEKAQQAATEAKEAAQQAQDSIEDAVQAANNATLEAQNATNAANNAANVAQAVSSSISSIQLDINMLKDYVVHNSPEDLNSFISVSRSYISNMRSQNLPVAADGWLDVDVSSNLGLVRQRYITSDSLDVYLRTANIPDGDNTEPVWSAWVQIAKKNYVDTELKKLQDNTTINGTILKYKGQVTAFTDLPVRPVAGDTYTVKTADTGNHIQAGDAVFWNGIEWKTFSGYTDTSGLAQSVEALQNEVTTTKQSVTTNTKSVEALQNEVTTTKQSVAANTKSVETLQTEVIATKQSVAANTQAIEDLKQSGGSGSTESESSLAQNGYLRYSNGLTVLWGRGKVNAQLSFPVVLTSIFSFVWSSGPGTSNTAAADINVTYDANGALVQDSDTSANYAISWQAVGLKV